MVLRLHCGKGLKKNRLNLRDYSEHAIDTHVLCEDAVQMFDAFEPGKAGGCLPPEPPEDI